MPLTSGSLANSQLFHLNVASCYRSWENREKWHCADIEIQKLVLRSIEAFLDCISNATLHHPLVKDSVADMVRALDSILEFKCQSILTLASSVAVKMVKILPSSMLQSHHIITLIRPLADLLASQQLQVAISCATALNVILSKLSFKQERVALEVLKERKAVGYLVHNVNQYCNGDKPSEYLIENASTLSRILWRWPSFRYHVWNDPEFLNALAATKFMSENSVKVAVLQLYSTLALCGNGGEKLLENGEQLLQMMICCMDNSNTHPVRMEAFKLARCLALSKRGCLKMMTICCEPFVKAVIGAMQNQSSPSGKLGKNQDSILEEACRLASSVTRWAGDHHLCFWKEGVDGCLLDFLLKDYYKFHQLHHESPVNHLIVVVQRSLDANLLLSLRPYIWDILGELATNCTDNIKHEMHADELRLKILVVCVCISFTDSVGMLRQHSHTPANMTEGESAARAILMMVYSPCEYIAALARCVLGEILNSRAKGDIEYFLLTLNAKLSGDGFSSPGNLQILVCLMSLACYCSLPKYQKITIKFQGLKTVIAFIRWWLNNPILVKRASIVPHLRDTHNDRLCCLTSTDEWEGEDMILLFSLWILADLLCQSAHGQVRESYNQEEFSEAEFILELQKICTERCSPGSNWYSAHVLSFFGLFGFPSKLGMRIGKLLGQSELSDMKLNIVNKDAVNVHEVVLMVRCPSLLRPRKSAKNEESSCDSTVKQDLGRNGMKVVHLSAQVEKQPLLQILEYVYLGYVQACEDSVKKLKVFARHCKLEDLLLMLCRKNPNWGAPVPSFDLRPALGPAGVKLSNLILEANETQMEDWECNNCLSLIPHLHVHKVILETSCEYLRALFQSGMQESNTQTIKVPVSWDSLNKLVSWFYSDELPVPNFDCIWNNLELEEKFREVQQYFELCWLAEYWFIKDLHEECYKVAVSCLNSSSSLLSAKLIQVAANLSLWELAQVAANCMAPSYHHLRDSGELDKLDSNLVEMVRVTSVRLRQEGPSQL